MHEKAKDVYEFSINTPPVSYIIPMMADVYYNQSALALIELKQCRKAHRRCMIRATQHGTRSIEDAEYDNAIALNARSCAHTQSEMSASLSKAIDEKPAHQRSEAT
jgi:hypothetical protein